MKIVVVGIGYVGLSNAIFLAQHNKVIACDIIQEKVDMLNKKILPIIDEEMNTYLARNDLDITATTDMKAAYADAEYVIIATPTNYDVDKNSFDTSTVESAITSVLSINQRAVIIIKSTVPIGYTENLKKLLKTENIIFSPEFLREGKALHDTLNPTRIIIGEDSPRARTIAGLFMKCTVRNDIPVLFMNSTEAEAIKLFSNTYLAMRVAYFNEIDTYSEMKNLDTRKIIEGICLDTRIGNYYNNPSFGYGGYCLPKDTKQLKANYGDIPNDIIGAIVDANETRKEHIVNMILRKNPKTVGIYRLTMKTESDNFRESSVLDIIKHLIDKGIKTAIYEPTLKGNTFYGSVLLNDLGEFKKVSNIIIANRWSEDINDVRDKVYSRDLYTRD